MPMTDPSDEDDLVFLTVPLASLAILLGETATALEHCTVTGQVLGILYLTDVAATASAAWAVRRVRSGDLAPVEAMDLDVVLADARRYATEHPGEVAAHDQRYAAYAEMKMRGER